MLKIKQAVIVEGKFDRMRLESVIDALIIEVGGFRIFNNREKQKFLRKLAYEKGILIITDSDASGFKIRSFLSGIIPNDKIFHAYIPDIYGKEKRKKHSSAEGKLGVEAMNTDIIIKAIEQSGIKSSETDNTNTEKIGTAELYELGLSGRENSSEKRRLLLRSFGLPERLSSSSFVKVINTYIGGDNFRKKAAELFAAENTDAKNDITKP